MNSQALFITASLHGIAHDGSTFKRSLTTFMTQTLFKFLAFVLVIATYYVVITDLGNIIDNLSLAHGLIKVVKFSHMGRALFHVIKVSYLKN